MSTRTGLTAMVLWLAAGLLATRASAQQGESPIAPPALTEDEASDASSDPSEERLEAWPWAVSVPLLAAAYTVELVHDPQAPVYQFVGPVDRGFEPWVVNSSRGRLRAARASDALLVATLAMPVLDAAFHSREGGSRSRDAYRLLAGDGLAFGLQAALVTISKSAIRRARPYNHRCDGTVDLEDCGSRSRYRGFVSGHSASAFTAASLVCAHQRLRGRSALGTVECVASLVLASLVGGLRIAAEKHYFADVVGGAIVGFLSGFVVPLVIYPRELPPAQPPAERIGPRAY